MRSCRMVDPSTWIENIALWSRIGFPPWMFVLVWAGWLVKKELRSIHDALQDHIKVTERRLLRLEIEREIKNEGWHEKETA